MKKGTTFLLKLVVILIGLPVAVLCLYLMPQLTMEAIKHLSNGAILSYVILGIVLIVYLSAIPYSNALYQAYKILTYIDKSQAFSTFSVDSLRKIKKSAILISGFYTLALPLIYIVAEWDDAPGLVLIGMIIIGAALVVCVFAAVLQLLLQEAITYKNENDLTI